MKEIKTNYVLLFMYSFDLFLMTSRFKFVQMITIMKSFKSGSLIVQQKWSVVLYGNI